jgi:hypothetical protein
MATDTLPEMAAALQEKLAGGCGNSEAVADLADLKETATDTPTAPPSTPTKKEDAAGDAPAGDVPEKTSEDEGSAVAERKKKPPKAKKPKEYEAFPEFKVTWDASFPTNLNKSPSKMKRRASQVNDLDKMGFISRAQEMSPEQTLVEFIVTSASFHNVTQQNIQALECDLLKVLINNVMPVNAAAWYMGRRINYDDCKILADILKKYPKKFLVINDVVHYLEDYTKLIAKAKMRYMTQQGLFAYFSHKVDEYGVYFFDPLYYEQTEPFHMGLRQVTNMFNTHRSKLVPTFFAMFKKQFHYQEVTPYLTAVSKIPVDKVTAITGHIVTMVDNHHGIIEFPQANGPERAIFNVKSVFWDGHPFDLMKHRSNPANSVTFDGYRVPHHRGDYNFHAALVWTGRKPNPKFCAKLDDLPAPGLLRPKMAGHHNNNGKGQEDNMHIGQVKFVNKNGAVVTMGKTSKDVAFVPGWAFHHRNTPNVSFLTTTQGVGLCTGDVVGFYLDPNQTCKPYKHVGTTIQVVKNAEFNAQGKPKKEKKPRTTSTGSAISARSHVSSEGRRGRKHFHHFLLEDEVAPEDEDEDEEADPSFELPIADPVYDDEDLESELSECELENLKVDADGELKDVPPEGYDPFSEVDADDESEDFKDAQETVEGSGDGVVKDKAEGETSSESEAATKPVKKSLVLRTRRISIKWAKLLIEDPIEEIEYDSDDDPEFVPGPLINIDCEYDEYSDGGIIPDDEVAELNEEARQALKDDSVMKEGIEVLKEVIDVAKELKEDVKELGSEKVADDAIVVAK